MREGGREGGEGRGGEPESLGARGQGKGERGEGRV
jgi:hypothetical protein